MKNYRRSFRRLALAGITTLALAAGPGRAHAAFTFMITQADTSVEITGSGTLDITALTLDFSSRSSSQIQPLAADLYAGPATPIFGAADDSIYDGGGFQGPTSFGTGDFTFADSGSGSLVGVFGSGDTPGISVPLGYVSGTSLTTSATYLNQTFASLGFTPGTYTYTWGTGADADSLTIVTVPEPSSWALLIGGAGLLALTLHNRRRIA